MQKTVAGLVVATLSIPALAQENRQGPTQQEVVETLCLNSGEGGDVPLSECIHKAEVLHVVAEGLDQSYPHEQMNWVFDQCHKLNGRHMFNTVYCATHFVADAIKVQRSYGDKYEFPECMSVFGEEERFEATKAFLGMLEESPDSVQEKVHQEYRGYSGPFLQTCK